ncbi:hypothetical protein ABIE91_006473 [Bradyrhizobium elkanii]
MWYDADIDAIMARTAMRPIPRGKVSRIEALVLGVVLGTLEPDKSFGELREMAKCGSIDLLREFSEACRGEFRRDARSAALTAVAEHQCDRSLSQGSISSGREFWAHQGYARTSIDSNL